MQRSNAAEEGVLNTNPKPRTKNRYASKRFMNVLYQMNVGFYRMKLGPNLDQTQK